MEMSRAEFREMFESHREPVFRFLWRLSGNPHDAEDRLQETFATFWRKRSQYRGDGSLLAYLRKIAYRTYLNSRARKAAKEPPLPLSAAPEKGVPGREAEVDERDAREFLRDRVKEALRGLPEGPREAFLMFRFEEMSVAEVAAVTESPVKTVESRLRRAHQLLARRLERYREQLIPRR
ncbi:MAG: sigma-70 family RNA polymerase sigma factor [Candidatus Latescibacteria bacterium]|nr:sigma-70 family RNA polymerase sigma factor [Candidatus Latescibacterota bacterium]